MICQQRVNRNFRYYKCSKQFRFGTSTCSFSHGIRGQELENELLAMILNSTKEYLENIQEKEIVGRADTKHLEDKITTFEQRKKELGRQQRDILKDKHLFDVEVYENMMLDVTREIKDCNEQIMIINKQLEEINKKEEHGIFAETFLERVSNIDIKNIHELRALFHDVIEEIVVLDKQTVERVRFSLDFLNPKNEDSTITIE
jgi:hypothetical protein